MLDKVTIKVRGGNGGKGVSSFRHEKYVPFGGPDGGDGGNGGDVILVAKRDISDLGFYRNNRVYRAENGGNGRGKKMHGKRGEPLFLDVPTGTVVFVIDAEGNVSLLADLKKDKDLVVVAKGGKGGRGNIHFASPTNRAPETAEAGTPGEEKGIILEMRLIADVGIIGFPNAGKSTLLSRVSAARPKIADYPFTTKEPVLGVVTVGRDTFTLAEIPGLIEGAHLGKGLGHDFLRHAMRVKIFIHLLNGTLPSPVADMRKLNSELELFDVSMAQKSQIVAVNKIDLPEVRSRMDNIRKEFARAGIEVCFISAETSENVPELMQRVVKLLHIIEKEPQIAGLEELPVLRPRSRNS